MDREPLDLQRLRAALLPSWTAVDVVEVTGSTNTDLLDLARDDPAADRRVLVAELQEQGRGRLERSWSSPPRAGLTASMLLRPPVPTARWGWLPLLVGVALAEAVREVAGVQASLKWPNDLLAPDGAKLAGVLAQSQGAAVVVGVGLNVSTQVHELPVETATSLALEGAGGVDRTVLALALLGGVAQWYDAWAAADGDADACGLRADYLSVCSTAGRPITVLRPGVEDLRGDAVSVDGDGCLVVRAAGGDVAVSAGDVVHLR